MLSTLADSGFVYALFDSTDSKHLACMDVMKIPKQRVYLPSITLPEVAHLVRRNIGGIEVAQVVRLLLKPPWLWLDAEPIDYVRAAEIIEQYRDANLDLVDSVITAMAERLNIQRILTLDRRDFSIIKPKHCAAFAILP